MDYKSAGVDTEKAARLIGNLKETIKKTHHRSKTGSVTGEFGQFAGAYRPSAEFSGSDIIAATDGVGTKIELYKQQKKFDGIGYDLVAMCVNDLYCSGAVPAFFLDYISCGRLDDEWYLPVMNSIASACTSVPMALLGGETAEHPGSMQTDDFDLAGFCVGFKKKNADLPDLRSLRAGNVIIMLPSSGIHSNGYSLVRKILTRLEEKDNGRYRELTSAPEDDENSFNRLFLEPTVIYSYLPELLTHESLKALVHVTGGGIYENLPRVLPQGLKARVSPPASDKIPRVFNFLSEFVELKEMYKTFNMGMGMLLIGDEALLRAVQKFEPRAEIIGELIEEAGEEQVILQNIDT